LVATMVYLKLGEDFFKKLYIDQKPAVIRDDRQLADALARGTYPIVLGLGQQFFQPLVDDKFPVEVVPNLPEVPDGVTAGFGLMGVMNHAPHPAAAKLFVNWLMSKEGMDFFGKAAQAVPVRLDADTSTFPKYLVPVPGRDYIDLYDYDFAVNQRL